ncbi:DUF4365 domain-containing protein [Actinocorallia herbida]|uniref:DUF4365 domain-containing protein n=1 Tax=Actinocorallia herbida TaxID=58109 RepID=UPI001FE4A6B6|nr:DUF4365 domain-containing protein [Actinocorallia herbida]
MRTQDKNLLQGDFGEAWLEAVAAGCGILHGRPTSLDLQKADVFLSYPGELNGTRSPSVLVQVKTTDGVRKTANGDFSYDLDVDTYEVLRQSNHSIRRILAVIGLSKDGERIRLGRDGTLLVGHGVWVSLEGRPATINRQTQVVCLPAKNALDEDGLKRMLGTFGVRTSTPVPDFNVWDQL